MTDSAELQVDGLTYRLRRARVSDVPATIALLVADQIGATRESPGADGLAAYEQAFAAIDADPAHQLVVVTTPEGDAVATMQVSYLPGMARRGSLRAQVEAVRVHAAHRRHGLGSALLSWAVEQARERGCSLVQLTSDKRRTEAHRFYGRLGFTASHDGFKLAL